MQKVACVRILNISLLLTIVSIIVLFIYHNFIKSHIECKPSNTTASGYASSKVCSGALIFEENFDKLDKHKWKPQVTLSTHGANGDFQMYVVGDKNSFAKDGYLHIKPTLTADKIGYDKVENGYILLEDCTDSNKANCERRSNGGNSIINPVRSARLNTKGSFAFRYGRIEVIAKMPVGDWLWPSIWLLPLQWKYGKGLRSGKIDLVESRGNIDYIDTNGRQIGVKRVTSTLQFGPKSNSNESRCLTFSKNNRDGFNNVFHRYECIWDKKGFKFFVDSIEIGVIAVEDGGFWKMGQFYGNNIWANGTKMAPFDEEFYLIISLAVGGTNGYFPDSNGKNSKKPWNNTSEAAMKDFWNIRKQWQSSWHSDDEDSSLIIDSIKVWAI